MAGGRGIRYPQTVVTGEEELGPQQLCRTCGEWWPADREFFYLDRGRASGMETMCRACWAEYQANRRAGIHRPVSPTATEERRAIWREHSRRYRSRRRTAA